MKRFFVLLAVLPLAGCITADPTPQQLANNEAKCSKFGFVAGTQQHAQCQLQLAQITQQQNQASMDQRQAAFAAMSAAGNNTPAPVFSPVTFGQPQNVYVAPQQTLGQQVNAINQARARAY